MAVRDGRGDVKQTTTGFRGPLMVQSLTSAKSKFLSLDGVIRKPSTLSRVTLIETFPDLNGDKFVLLSF